MPAPPSTNETTTSDHSAAPQTDPGDRPRVLLERRYRFCASHLYRRPEWSEEKNRAHFGPCANLPGHGHNYRLQITVSGVVDPLTGFLCDLPALDASVRREIVEQLDHQHINHAIEAFHPGGLIPSSEELVIWMLQRLEPQLPSGCRLEILRLEEDDDLAAEWRRSILD
ncbi:MAG: 6-carboxytetrahydropterin synthase [Acidobacteriota bacterium]